MNYEGTLREFILIRDEMAKEIKDKDAEIERLTQVEESHRKINGELREENKKLQQRIEKTIEYIEGEMSHHTSNGIRTRKYLIEILKGSDKE